MLQSNSGSHTRPWQTKPKHMVPVCRQPFSVIRHSKCASGVFGWGRFWVDRCGSPNIHNRACAHTLHLIWACFKQKRCFLATVQTFVFRFRSVNKRVILHTGIVVKNSTAAPVSKHQPRFEHLSSELATFSYNPARDGPESKGAWGCRQPPPSLRARRSVLGLLVGFGA